jgi:hypothetical protein
MADIQRFQYYIETEYELRSKTGLTKQKMGNFSLTRFVEDPQIVIISTGIFLF